MPVRIVLDTNVILSAALRVGSVPHRAYRKARGQADLIASDETLEEFLDVLRRDKFDRFVSRELREALFREFTANCRIIPIPTHIRVCRDPRDDKFLSLAVHGEAEWLLTGDADLLHMHPFQGIFIVTPQHYLDLE